MTSSPNAAFTLAKEREGGWHGESHWNYRFLCVRRSQMMNRAVRQGARVRINWPSSTARLSSPGPTAVASSWPQRRGKLRKQYWRQSGGCRVNRPLESHDPIARARCQPASSAALTDAQRNRL